MARFVTVTPNPALDRILTVAGLRTGVVNRASSVALSAGGKGVNAARVLRTLGADVCALGYVGGGAGAELVRLLDVEGLKHEFVEIDSGETRHATVIVNPESGVQTVINEIGPWISAPEVERMRRIALSHARAGAGVLMCGSVPPGMTPSDYAELISSVRSSGGWVMVDSSKETLDRALEASPNVLKVNRSELAEIGYPIEKWNTDAVAVVEQVVRKFGLEAAAITDGAAGALAWTASGAYFAAPPPVEVVSAVGSGDAFAAGLAFALFGEQAAMADALRLACACGAANAMNAGGGVLTLEQVAQLSGRIEVEKVA